MCTPQQQEFIDYFETQMGSQIPVPGLIIMRRPDQQFVGHYEMVLVSEELDIPSPATVTIAHTWNKDTREVNGTVEVIFDSVPDSGDLRVGVLVTEDKVKGGYYYNQRSYYNNSTEYFELIGLGSTIKGYEHMDVFRDAILDGVWGKDGVIPDIPEIGISYTTVFSYVVPEQYIDLNVKLENVKLVAFAAYYKGNVLNADEVDLLKDTEIINNSAYASSQKVKINSINSENISFVLNILGTCKLSMYTSSGKKANLVKQAKQLSSGAHTISLRRNNFSAGVYFLHLNGAHIKTVMPLVISK